MPRLATVSVLGAVLAAAVPSAAQTPERFDRMAVERTTAVAPEPVATRDRVKDLWLGRSLVLDQTGTGQTPPTPAPRPQIVRAAVPPPASRPIGFRAFFLSDANFMSASESFTAVLGTSRFNAIGGGGEVLKIWNDLFARVAVSKASRVGERVFVIDGDVFPLGIPITIETRPVEIAAGWRFENAFRKRLPQAPPRPGQPGYAPRGPVTNPPANPNAPTGSGGGGTGTGSGTAGGAGTGPGGGTAAGRGTGAGSGAGAGGTPPAPGQTPPAGQGTRPTPAQAVAAAAARPPRAVPYIGGGLLMMAYRETSDFALAGDNVDDSFKGYTLFGGIDVRVTKLLFVGAEAQYRGIANALGQSGASLAFAETNLGGFTARVLIGVKK
jgi:hypothetical protein